MSTNNDALVFDPNALKQRISDGVRTAFGMMIPDEQFQALVEKEIAAFFDEDGLDYVFEEVDKNPSSYNSSKYERLKARVSPFRLLVWKAVSEECVTRIKALTEDPEFKSRIDVLWKDGRDEHVTQLTERQEKLLEQMAPTFVPMMFRHMFGSMLLQSHDQLRNEMTTALQRIR